MSPLFPVLNPPSKKPGRKAPRNHDRVVSLPALHVRREPSLLWAEEVKSPLFPVLGRALRRRNAVKNGFVGVVAVAGKSEKGHGSKGAKEFNQDSYHIAQHFFQSPGSCLLTLSDGHGMHGHFVSAHVCQLLPGLLSPAQHLSGVELHRQAQTLFREAAHKLQKAVVSTSAYSSKYSGATLVAAFVHDATLVCSNVGDSRALLVQAQDPCWGWKQLTTDHKPDILTEKARIESFQGHVEPLKSSSGEFLGPARVWVPGEDAPGLAMSRSLGDQVAHTAGVIETPDVLLHSLSSRDRAVVLASDGLWDVVSNTEVAMIVQRQWQNCEVCCLELVTTASNRWKRSANGDDVTVVVATLSC